MKIGYARVSTGDQSLDLQCDALKQVGCEKIFEDVASGAKTDRKGLEESLDYLREGDVLVVWKLDRLGRSLKHLIELCLELNHRNIHLQSVRENIDTNSPIGKLFFHLIASLAEFERDLIRDRTLAGLEAARARGKKGGRKPKLNTQEIDKARAMTKAGVNSIDEICDFLKVSRSTFYRHVQPYVELSSP